MMYFSYSKMLPTNIYFLLSRFLFQNWYFVINLSVTEHNSDEGAALRAYFIAGEIFLRPTHLRCMQKDCVLENIAGLHFQLTYAKLINLSLHIMLQTYIHWFHIYM